MDVPSVLPNVVRVKDHRRERDLADDDHDAKCLFWGNKIVDELAKEGAGLHASDPIDIGGYEQAVKDLSCLAYGRCPWRSPTLGSFGAKGPEAAERTGLVD